MRDKKVKLSVLPKVILRIPRIPVSGTLQEYWAILKQLIKESSPEFFRIIEDIGYEQLSEQPIKVQETVWKYFNRSRYRSTPFGGFAAVCSCNASYKMVEPTALQVTEEPTYLCFSDWSRKEEVSYTYSDLLYNEGMLLCNSSFYRLPGGIIRYIARNEGKFEILEVPEDPFITEILKLCISPVLLTTVIEELHNYDKQTIQSHIESLVDIQLLYTSLDANIIGQDYFTRIGFTNHNEESSYTITSRDHLSGTFDLHHLKHLELLFEVLNSLTSSNKSHLTDFATRFSQRYDLEEIPLMVALDPQYGIGYGNFDRPLIGDNIIFDLAGRTADQDTERMPLPLLKAFVGANGPGQPKEIDLEDIELEPENSNIQPNSTSILFSLAQDEVWISSIGGATGTALLGRFTHASDDIFALTKDIADMEASANPDVIFFDIGYEAEGHVDNVNRRRSIYAYQLALLSYSITPFPLQLDDILVSVRSGKVILRSISLGKRLIPRLASAYNHSRSDLSVFRFLCDLQHQGIRSNLNINIRQVIPGMKYYPRIKFRQYILSPRMWILHKDNLLAGNDLLKILRSLDVPRYVCTGAGDQVLHFDLENKEDVQMMERIIRKQTETRLEETPPPASSRVIDKELKPYNVQFLATVVHHRTVYNAYNPTFSQASIQRQFISGLEWHYFEIYCHPIHSDRLLMGTISRFLEVNSNTVLRSFFIRYNEGGEHIRFRFQTVKAGDYTPIVRFLRSIEMILESGLISDIQQKVYKREIERYGFDTIEKVESFFCIDSGYALEILKHGLDDYQKYALCISLMQQVMDGNQPDTLFEARNRTMLKAYEKEHQVGSREYKKLNQLFQNFQRSSPWETIHRFYEQTTGLAESLGTLLAKSGNNEKLYADLIHMHINRLFASHQRTHELAIYYILDKINIRRSRFKGNLSYMVS